MTDVLAERCAALAEAVVPLLSAAIQSQGSPKALDDVIVQIEAVRAVVLTGGADAAGSAYAAWAGVAPGILDQMEAAARAGDPATVWAPVSYTHLTLPTKRIV